LHERSTETQQQSLWSDYGRTVRTSVERQPTGVRSLVYCKSAATVRREYWDIRVKVYKDWAVHRTTSQYLDGTERQRTAFALNSTSFYKYLSTVLHSMRRTPESQLSTVFAWTSTVYDYSTRYKCYSTDYCVRG
jgi:hypothetical protein